MRDYLDYPRHWLLPVAVAVIGMFMSALNTTVVNGAMSAIEKEFDVTSEDIQWISIAYKIGLAAVAPASAWLSERLGLRRMYLIILLLFGLTAALCGMSTGLDSLIFFRILQSVPGALTPVASIMILYRLVPRQKLGLAMSMYALCVVSAPGGSSLVSGFMVEHLNWRWIFYFEMPVSVLGIIVTLAVLPSLPGRKDRRFDLPGFACIALGLGALMLALSKGQDWGRAVGAGRARGEVSRLHRPKSRRCRSSHVSVFVDQPAEDSGVLHLMCL
jgi:MFS family permease